MTGGNGSDTFVITKADGVADYIADYNPNVGGDTIDLTALFDAAANGSDLATYVKLTNTGQLQVDVDGEANGSNFVTVATVDTSVASVGVQAPATVTIVFDDAAGIAHAQAISQS